MRSLKKDQELYYIMNQHNIGSAKTNNINISNWTQFSRERYLGKEAYLYA